LKLQAQRVLNKAQELGWLINHERFSLIPSRQFAFLGMQIDTLNSSVQPVQSRLDNLTQAIKVLLASSLHTQYLTEHNRVHGVGRGPDPSCKLEETSAVVLRKV
jgi:hypothetical protein